VGTIGDTLLGKWVLDEVFRNYLMPKITPRQRRHIMSMHFKFMLEMLWFNLPGKVIDILFRVDFVQ
jgi:hypothetical protein